MYIKYQVEDAGEAPGGAAEHRTGVLARRRERRVLFDISIPDWCDPRMLTLVYKRTHRGDPRTQGVFGIEGCMRRVRGYDFDAVIGVGGIGPWAKRDGIDGKINWIGVGRREVGKSEIDGYPLLAFEHFRLFEEKGAPVPPALAKRFCHAKAPRYVIYDFDEAELAEIKKLLASVKNEPPSPGPISARAARTRKCPPKRKCPPCTPKLRRMC